MQLKRILVSLLVVVLMLSATVVIGAEDTVLSTTAATFDIAVGTEPAAESNGTLVVKAGDKIDVSITITGNPGVSMLQFVLKYNADVLAPVVDENNEVVIEKSDIFTFEDSVRDFDGVRVEEDKGVITFTSDLNNKVDITATGLVAKLSFTVKEDAHGEGNVELVDVIAYKANYDKITTNATTVNVLAHTLAEEAEVIAPTCTEGGYSVLKCTQCDYKVEFDAVEATGHTEEPYGIDGIRCSDCGEILRETSVETESTSESESVESGTETSAPETETDATEEEDDGFPIWIIIVIVVVVLVGAGAAVFFFVIKKKK